ncbi:MAG: helix-turn-helix domain-containing protein [Thermomicrobiales bacterium]
MATPDLGTLLRRWRRSALLSQEELAERSSVSVRTISDLERGIRRTARLETIRLLASALELSESDRIALTEASVPRLPFAMTDVGQSERSFSPPASSNRLTDQDASDRPQDVERRNEVHAAHVIERQSGIPLPLTSFVGRERAVDELYALVQQQNNRLVTLTGPGGVGKTRLALTVAAKFSNDPGWHVSLIPLAPIESWHVVVSTICQTFGVFESAGRNAFDGIAEAIGDRRHLLLLDNFERVIDAAAFLTEIAARCPTLSILVTSRVVLRVSGEREFPVQPLQVPDSSASIEQIAESPAVQLLQDRISATGGQGVGNVTPSDLPHLAEICRRLDGLPLAIELAGARARVFSVAELASGLRNGVIALDRGPRDAPHRHQSVRAAVSWSHDLLTIEEKRLFRLLAVFAGGFSLESAVSVYMACMKSHNAESLATPHELVSSLLEQSLVSRTTTEDGRPRFVMLESIREFARDRLIQSGEEHVAERIHAEHFASKCAAIDEWRTQFHRGEASSPLEEERDNFRVAIDYALLENDCDLAARLISGTIGSWRENGQYSEARATLARTLQCPGTLEKRRRARLLLDASFFAWNQGDFEQCQSAAVEGLALCQELDNSAGIAEANYLLGLSVLSENPEQARDFLSTAVRSYRQGGDDAAMVCSLEGLGGAHMYVGNLTQARSVFTEANEIRASTGSDQGDFDMMGWLAVAEGNLELAHTLLIRSLSRSRESGSLYHQIPSLRLLGRVAAKRGDFDGAARYFSEALTLGLQLGSAHECVFCVAEYAAVAQACGESDRAARWLGFEEMFREHIRLGLTPDEKAVRDETRQRAVRAMGESAYIASWSSGQRLKSHAVFSEARDWRP